MKYFLSLSFVSVLQIYLWRVEVSKSLFREILLTVFHLEYLKMKCDFPMVGSFATQLDYCAAHNLPEGQVLCDTIGLLCCVFHDR